MRQDIDQILIAEEAICVRLDAMAEEIQRDFRAEGMVVMVLLKGAMVFAADLTRRIPHVMEIESLRVASYHGGTESSGRVDFLDAKLPDVRGKQVLVLDDILDTGRTLRAVVDRLEAEGARSVKTGVLLAKERKRDAMVEANYVGFHIKDEFVVGYGLDYRERYRNLPFIGTLKNSVVA